jgi:hypothetical protein
MRVVVVVGDLVQLFAGDIQIVGQIVVSGRNYKLSGAMLYGSAKTVHGMDGEISIAAGDAFDGLVLSDIELVMLSYLAVILQRFITARFLIGTREGDIPYLQKLRGREEGHVRRIVK